MIQYIEDQKQFILSGTKIAYVFCISEEGFLNHAYFGEKMVHLRDYPCPFLSEDSSSFTPGISLTKEEYLAWGSNRFTTPALKASSGIGLRDIDLRYKSHELLSDNLSIHLSDPQFGIEVIVQYQVIEYCDLLIRSAKIINQGKEPIVLDQAFSGHLHLPSCKSSRLHYVSGKWIGEFQLQSMMLPQAKVTLESKRGNTSHHSNPFVLLDPNGEASENSGSVYAAHLAYSGNWSISLEQTSHNQTKLTAGINDFDFSWVLSPGNTLELPSLLLAFSKDGFGGISRAFHDYQRKGILHASNRSHERKVLYNSWEASYFDVSEHQQLELAEKAAALGVELFVMDDGWFGERHSDQAGLGDWHYNPKKFPHGLTPLIERVHELGMDFGLWVEPEMVNPDSNLYREHPDWVYGYHNQKGTLLRNQLVLNLSLAEVRKYIISFMSDLLSHNQIEFIKWDMNRAITEPGSLITNTTGKTALQQGTELWHRHVQGLYEVLGVLKELFPQVSFQACSGGGGRVDLGILQYCDQFWVSDNTDALDRLKIQEGFSQIYSAKTMESWVTAKKNWVNQREVPLEFRFHVAMMGVLGIGDDISQWSADESKQAKEYINQYKQYRTIIQDGDQYRLKSPSPETQAVLYVSKTKTEAVLFAFAMNLHHMNNQFSIQLDGLEDNSNYLIKETGQKSSGKALRINGIPITFSKPLDSKLIYLQRL